MRRVLRPMILAGALASTLAVPGCGEGSREAPERDLDTRLETHAVVPGRPSAEGLAYLEFVAKAHREADELDEAEARAAVLVEALERDPPADDGAAELVHYGLAARAGEALLEAGQPGRARALLEPLLTPSRSLPLDRGTARALVVLGDAAAREGDQDLAMASYARALEVLSMLLEEVDS